MLQGARERGRGSGNEPRAHATHAVHLQHSCGPEESRPEVLCCLQGRAHARGREVQSADQKRCTKPVPLPLPLHSSSAYMAAPENAGRARDHGTRSGAGAGDAGSGAQGGGAQHHVDGEGGRDAEGRKGAARRVREAKVCQGLDSGRGGLEGCLHCFGIRWRRA